MFKKIISFILLSTIPYIALAERIEKEKIVVSNDFVVVGTSTFNVVIIGGESRTNWASSTNLSDYNNDVPFVTLDGTNAGNIWGNSVGSILVGTSEYTPEFTNSKFFLQEGSDAHYFNHGHDGNSYNIGYITKQTNQPSTLFIPQMVSGRYLMSGGGTNGREYWVGPSVGIIAGGTNYNQLLINYQNGTNIGIVPFYFDATAGTNVSQGSLRVDGNLIVSGAFNISALSGLDSLGFNQFASFTNLDYWSINNSDNSILWTRIMNLDIGSGMRVGNIEQSLSTNSPYLLSETSYTEGTLYGQANIYGTSGTESGFGPDGMGGFGFQIHRNYGIVDNTTNAVAYCIMRVGTTNASSGINMNHLLTFLGDWGTCTVTKAIFQDAVPVVEIKRDLDVREQIYVSTNTLVTWGERGTNYLENEWRMGPVNGTSFVFQVYDGANWTNAYLFNRPTPP